MTSVVIGDCRQSRPPDQGVPVDFASAACVPSASTTPKAGRPRKKKSFRGVARQDVTQQEPIQEQNIEPPPFAQPPDPAKLRETSPVIYAETERGRPYSQMLGTETRSIQFDAARVVTEIDDICAGPWMVEKRKE